MSNRNDEVDRDTLLRLAEILKRESGISLQGLREDLVRARLTRRIKALELRSIAEYATVLETDAAELPSFVNLMTTNHTYFFREQPHLDFLSTVFFPHFFAKGARPLSIWCAACSTGEEPYTLAILAHRFLAQRGWEAKVRITGTDINTEALRTAQNGVYPVTRLSNVPREIRMAYFRQGRIPHDKFYRVNDNIRELVKFSPLNLISPVEMFRRFDLVMCRNVLIYFEPQTVRQVVRFLSNSVMPDGAFITGLSEQVERYDPRLHSIGRSIYVFDEESPLRQAPVADSPARSIKSPRRSSTATARRSDVQRRAAELIATSGQAPTRTRAEERPPVQSTRASSPESTASNNPARGASIAASRRARIDAPPLIAIGASTGGIEALQQVVSRFRRDGPAVLIAQHIPPKFSTNLAETLSLASKLPVHEAKSGEPIVDGHIYVSPGGRHFTVRRRERQLLCVIRDTPARRFRPSVDLLFESLAALDGVRVLAAILTGMGDDGARGALALRNAGHYVIGQDEATSLVYGMPAAAAALGALDLQLPLADIGGVLVSRAGTSRRGSAA